VPASMDRFRDALEKLIRKFGSDESHYLSKHYSEAQARIDFITPFFKALGWDVENEAGLPHHQREVIVERGESETTGRPDYSFRVGGQTKFFVEAKAPSEPLDTARHILQAKGYAWNTRQVFFVILTDFEEFRFYDASSLPDERRPDEGLLLKLKCTDYLANPEKLWEFSKERVTAGSLDALLPRIRRAPHLRKQVDEVFLDEMTGWREDLAKDIHKRNPGLTAKQLNEVVQRLLDRIVFIRIAEDRHVIEKRQLADAVENWETHGGKFPIFDWLNDLFHKINEDFNGEIFKPHLSEDIQVDSEILARIIKRLYPPKSPYRFDVIGVELLGSIYERYLGNTIRLTPKQVKLDKKPEVRKAGGVYYTPKYIVDYIVKNTVGKVMEGKAPKQIEKIRILDPACGSGSFLIGAFQYLIDYYVRYLTAHPKEAHVHPLYPDLMPDGNGGHRLSVGLKAKILRRNLFGADIDPQAVEITMMSLYLKALEGEKSQLPPKQSLLPELKYNIICGNSLIGPDIYDQGTLFGDEERDRINAFDWNSDVAGFGRIMKEGRFDCVIGNPPYLFVVGMDRNQKDYFAKSYKTWSYRFDVYGAFIERGLEVLRDSGPLGFIVPHTLLTNDSFKELRKLLLEENSIEKIVDIGPGVFQSAKNETMILVVSRGKPGHGHKFRFVKTTAREFNAEAPTQVVRQGDLVETPGQRLIPPGDLATRRLTARLDGIEARFGTIFRINQGLRTGDNEKFLTAKRTQALHRPALGGKHLKRYWCESPLYVLYDPKRLDAPRDEDNYTSPEKIVVQEVRNITLPRRIIATYDDRRRYCLQSTNTINWKPGVERPFSMTYALGILNSTLLNWYFRSRFRGNNHIASNQLASLPLLVPSQGVHERVAALVDRMLELSKRKHSGRLAPSEIERLDRDIGATDAQIDGLVYDLYGITQEERKIIEGARGQALR